MKLHLWGTDFRRSSPELRARLFCPPEVREAKIKELLSFGFRDLIYLNTCNRIEFYTTGDDYFSDSRPLWMNALKSFGLNEEDFYRGYHLEGKSALRHLLRVASSLESLVVGEPMILGQLKEAMRWTKERNLPVDRSLERCFSLAFETAKTVRAQTGIAEKPVSVATLGLRHLQATERERALRKAVVVGRSPICLQILQWLAKNRPQCPVLWVNRDPSKLSGMNEAKFSNVTVGSLSEFIERPCEFSHLFTATSSSVPLFTSDFFSRVSGAPLVFDFAQPADVDRSEVRDSVKVFHLEDFQQEALENASARAQAVVVAEKLIEQAIRSYCLEQKQAPLLREFSGVEPKFLEELAMALSSLEKEFPPDAQAKLRKQLEKLVKRNLHHSREYLRTLLNRVTDPDDQFRHFVG